MEKYLPIIYVRGYAGSQRAVESTVDRPYYGFNLGSTQVRARWAGLDSDLPPRANAIPAMTTSDSRCHQRTWTGGSGAPCPG